MVWWKCEYCGYVREGTDNVCGQCGAHMARTGRYPDHVFPTHQESASVVMASCTPVGYTTSNTDGYPEWALGASYANY